MFSKVKLVSSMWFLDVQLCINDDFTSIACRYYCYYSKLTFLLICIYNALIYGNLLHTLRTLILANCCSLKRCIRNLHIMFDMELCLVDSVKLIGSFVQLIIKVIFVNAKFLRKYLSHLCFCFFSLFTCFILW